MVQVQQYSEASTRMIPTMRVLLRGALLLLLSSRQTHAFVQALSINKDIGDKSAQQHEPRFEMLPAATASRTHEDRILSSVLATATAHEGVVSRADMVAISMRAVSVGATTAALNVMISHPCEAAAARSNEELVSAHLISSMVT